jgi:hypothetical protein
MTPGSEFVSSAGMMNPRSYLVPNCAAELSLYPPSASKKYVHLRGCKWDEAGRRKSAETKIESQVITMRESVVNRMPSIAKFSVQHLGLNKSRSKRSTKGITRC